MRGLVGAVVAMGLLVGCGGVEAEEVAPEVEESQDVTQFKACSNQQLLEWYSDASYTVLIGWERCECELVRPERTGSSSAYQRVVYRYACH